MVVNYDDTSTKLFLSMTGIHRTVLCMNNSSVLYEQVRTGGVTKFGGKNFGKLFICFNITSRSLASPVSFRHKLSTVTKQFFFSVREDANLNVHFT